MSTPREQTQDILRRAEWLLGEMEDGDITMNNAKTLLRELINKLDGLRNAHLEGALLPEEEEQT